MDHNEISMFMDVKLDIHDKRAIAQRYKTWTRCQVKIEAIKCVPCFLRLSFQNPTDATGGAPEEPQQQKVLSVSVNVPGVSISLATSRTKQHSYGLFWTQNRRECFIYFSLETETSCRRHMKWIKKSIKNLELFRQVFLEQRRMSRGPSAQNALGPLPNLPDSLEASFFASRYSEIYEEIFDGSRISRASIASGIYEEMKPSAWSQSPPAPPPLPAHRKRLNTFECEQPSGLLGEIPRSSTNPESELAKKKKYKNMLDNLFGGARQKRTASVGEPAQQPEQPIIYENAPSPPLPKCAANIAKSQRNSFSSPDLSKLNFLDTFGDALLQLNSDESSIDLNVSLDESAIEPATTRQLLLAKITKQLTKADSLESLNVSEQLPHNFNFSACNSSTINLIGSNGAVPHSNLLMQKNKILVDDLTGYCVMAPIVKKSSTQLAEQHPQPAISTGSTSSGYSTGSYSSSTSSCNHEEPQSKTLTQKPLVKPPTPPPPPPAQNESAIYEAMHGSSLNSTDATNGLAAGSGFAEHLYENLLAVKAAQELEQPLGYGLSTSTPTDSPLMPPLPQKGTPKGLPGQQPEEEDFYSTPRKSIISVDEKVPSYYPNSCDTLKSKRRSPSIDNAAGLRHLVSAKLRRERKENLYISSPQQILEQRQKPLPNVPTTSPSTSSTSSTANQIKTKEKTNKKTAAHKISEGVYAVTHAGGKRLSNNTPNNNNNNNEVATLSAEVQQKLEEELLQLAMLQNIDFKFDDSQTPTTTKAKAKPVKASSRASPGIVQPKLEDEYEHCYQAAERATRLLQKYATLAKFGNSPTKSPQQPQRQQDHQLLVSQTANIKAQEAMTQSQSAELAPSGVNMKKFASLPRFKKIDFSPLKLRLNNVLQRHQQPAALIGPQQQPQPLPLSTSSSSK